jgi:hypothetical protein
VLDVLRFVERHDLVGNVDPVQFTIRLLIPEGSLLVEHPALEPHLEGYDPELLSYRWRAADPRCDELQVRLAALVEGSIAAGEPPLRSFERVRAAVLDVAGLPDEGQILAGSVEGRPRLTEPWFC